MNKYISVFMAICLVFGLTTPALAAEADTLVSPRYSNAISASAHLNINSNGLATISINCSGKSSVTSISAVYYLEKQYIGSWKRVDIGTTDDEWACYTSSTTLSRLRTFQLTDPGNYRLVAEFTVRASSTETFTMYSSTILY